MDKKNVEDGRRRDGARAVIVKVLVAQGFTASQGARLLNSCGWRPALGQRFSRSAVAVWWKRVMGRTDIAEWCPDPTRLSGEALVKYRRESAVDEAREAEVFASNQRTRERRVRRTLLTQSRPE